MLAACSLVSQGLVAEAEAGPGDPVWRTSDDHQRLTLVATDAALAALGIAPEEAPETAPETAADVPPTLADEGQEADAATVDATPAEEVPVAPTAPATRKVRAGSKQARLIEMLERPEGATIDEIGAAFGWQPHTVRGAIAGALKKRLGLDVTSDKEQGRGRVYRIKG